MVMKWQRKAANWTSPKQHGLEERFVLEVSRAEMYCITVSLCVKWQQTSKNKGFSFSILISECIRLLFLKLLENDFLSVVKLIVSMYFKHNKRQCLFRNVFFLYLDSLLDTNWAQLCFLVAPLKLARNSELKKIWLQMELDANHRYGQNWLMFVTVLNQFVF